MDNSEIALNGNVLKRSVCVIGAGAAGLCALRHFSTQTDRFDPIVCYEQSDAVGGTWNYTDQVGIGPNGLKVHSSMYRDLRVNAPVQIMGYQDFTFESTQSYTGHAEVIKYLNQYTAYFNLVQYIEFEHHLQLVTRDKSLNCWKVDVLNMSAGKTFSRHFDIVVLCPGRYSTPFWPTIQSIDQFTGSIIHSHDYRCREPYTGKQVVVIGAGPSGIDISLEVASVATQVLFVNTSKNQYSNLPTNVQQIKGEILEMGANSIRIQIQNNTRVFQINSVILATGYRLNLDYLDLESCGLKLDGDNTVYGIYRHMINMKYPTMALLSVCRPTLSFPLFEQQLLLNQIHVPSCQEMEFEIEQNIVASRALGQRTKDRHLLKSVSAIKEYFELLERDGQLEPLKLVVYKLLDEAVKGRSGNPTGYKKLNYRLLSEEEFVLEV